MKIKTIQLLTLFILSLGIVACGGDEDDTQHAKGTLVVPKSSQKVASKALKRADGVKFKDECPNVPAGYSPLKNTKVEFLNESGKAVDDTTTDSCGEFSANVPNEVVKVKAKSSGNKDLVTDVTVFQTSGDTAIASTIPAGAEYQISAIQITSDNSLAFSVTDTVTNNAVIGVPDTAITAKLNNNPVTTSNLKSAAQVSDPASITLVMDASGSMTRYTVNDKEGNPVKDANDKIYSRIRMSALAAHTYLDNMPKSDETSFVIFDEDVDFMNDTKIASLFSLINPTTGDALNYEFSSNGFTQDATKLRFLADAYNAFSLVYPLSSNIYASDKKHEDTPKNLSVNSGYPWNGNTAAFDAILEGLEKTKVRPNNRKVIIAMTDGENNRGERDENVVIDAALNQSIPVYTIGFGTKDNANVSMKNIAESTNASFLKVEGTDLISAFQSIQTGIIFQYLTELGTAVTAGDVIELTLNYNGVKVTRKITR